MPAEYWPAAQTVFDPESVNVISRSNFTVEASFVAAPIVRFLIVTDDALEADGTTMRYSPFVEKPCISALAEIVTMPVDFENDQPLPELSLLLTTIWSFTTRCPRCVTLPLPSMSNEK